ncbi:MAG TPA: polysaccharide biosynthesis/export family protein [Pyrinomonadaceae bacterium]|jgi:polysaccharide export outer membrane protein|nr:polysaccharide biosynthesis/export family protein [Pyrinomonadaceae bacterium]
MNNRQSFLPDACLAARSRLLFCASALLALFILPGVASAQQALTGGAAASQSSPSQALSTASNTTKPDDRYRIGAGDLLDIRILNRPQLTRDAIRVDGRGMIRMPFFEREIQAACRTESELAAEIAAGYLKYLKNPQVDVFVKEFNSQPVAVIGAVNAPGRFQLQRRVRLLELLTFAGGPAERAGRNIQVVHADAASLCEPAHASGDPAEGLSSYALVATLRGDESANPYVQAGDVITLPDAEQVYVVGNVLKPSAFALKEPITVSRAIAMAGGVMPDTKSDRVRIVRQMPGSTVKTEIYVDLKAIDKRQAEDIALLANDIVDVPTSTGKRLLRSLLGAIVPSISQIPVRVIP